MTAHNAKPADGISYVGDPDRRDLSIAAFVDEETGTVSYVVADENGGDCIVLDSVLDYDASTKRLRTTSADRIIRYIQERRLSCGLILETHAHADHISAGIYLRAALGARWGAGSGMAQVQESYIQAQDVPGNVQPNGSHFDILFGDGDTIPLGRYSGHVWHTPGHTPSCTTYVFDGAAFIGDTLFMPNLGTARCDFPGGDARQLFRSIKRILSLPAQTKLYSCHDYRTPERNYFAWESTVGDQAALNRHVGGGACEEDFVRIRTARDATLPQPRLIHPSIPVNIGVARIVPAGDPSSNNLWEIYFPSSC